jgi:hypothetical protein
MMTGETDLSHYAAEWMGAMELDSYFLGLPDPDSSDWFLYGSYFTCHFVCPLYFWW